MPSSLTRSSKFLSLVLRHRPEVAGVEPDAEGWVAVDLLLDGARGAGVELDRETLGRVVAENDKRRFEFSDDGARIRARQGHSIPVELGLEPAVPPDTLYHGTVDRFMGSIRKEGLQKGQRHHVHLSADLSTATRVGERRGQPVILVVDAVRMHADGFVFTCTANGVWLVDHVPPPYLTESTL